MEADFWHQRWQQNQIGFHEGAANVSLVEHFKDIVDNPSAHVFVPLCGKTRDIPWLMEQGYRVTGAELSQIAVEQLFEEMRIKPEISKVGQLTKHRANGVTIFAGDVFELSSDDLGPIDIVYDRAALVALPDDMRKAYADHMVRITDTAPQFLLTFEYDQSIMDGPPFSLTSEDVSRCYAQHYEMTRRASREVPNGLKGFCPATENLWLLKAR